LYEKEKKMLKNCDYDIDPVQTVSGVTENSGSVNRIIRLFAKNFLSFLLSTF
jgi:hypothetical protein